MQIKLLKILLITIILLYQTTTYSKTSDLNKFNHKYLSNYFSALLYHFMEESEDLEEADSEIDNKEIQERKSLFNEDYNQEEKRRGWN